MLNKGEYAVCGNNGVCMMTGTEERSGMLYYVFEPLYDKTMKVFIPVESSAVRKPICRKEADELLESIDGMSDIWLNDSRDRRKKYAGILASLDLPEITELAKTLYRKKYERKRNGKTMYSYEEGQLRTAERVIAGELSFAFGISPDEAVSMLENRFLGSAAV